MTTRFQNQKPEMRSARPSEILLSALSALTLAILLLPAVAAAQTPAGLSHLWSGEGAANDSVGTADGIPGATTSFAPGLNGLAFDFTGSQSDVVTLPVNIDYSALPQMTMGMWVKLDTVANSRGWVMGHDNGGFDRSLVLHDNRYGFGVAAGVGTTYASTLPKLGDSLGQWSCVAVAFDRSALQAMVYADGSTQSVGAGLRNHGLSTTTLGGLALFPSHTIDGLVDEVFIFNRVLSAAEIDQACLSFSSTASDKIDALADLISSLGLSFGIETALTAKLNAALKSLAEGDSDSALDEIQAFINHVLAQDGKKISSDDADLLLVLANDIVDTINRQ